MIREINQNEYLIVNILEEKMMKILKTVEMIQNEDIINLLISALMRFSK